MLICAVYISSLHQPSGRRDVYTTGFLLFRDRDAAAGESLGLDTGSPSQMTGPLSEAFRFIGPTSRCSLLFNTVVSVSELFMGSSKIIQLHFCWGFYLTSCQEWSGFREEFIRIFTLQIGKMEAKPESSSKSGQTVRETEPGKFLSVCPGALVKMRVAYRLTAQAADKTSSGANHSVPLGFIMVVYSCVTSTHWNVRKMEKLTHAYKEAIAK